VKGSCDCCNAQDVRLTFHIVTGIETYACAKCSSGDPRRCETNECGLDGECLACGAISGEVCQDDDSTETQHK